MNNRRQQAYQEISQSAVTGSESHGEGLPQNVQEWGVATAYVRQMFLPSPVRLRPALLLASWGAQPPLDPRHSPPHASQRGLLECSFLGSVMLELRRVPGELPAHLPGPWRVDSCVCAEPRHFECLARSPTGGGRAPKQFALARSPPIHPQRRSFSRAHDRWIEDRPERVGAGGTREPEPVLPGVGWDWILSFFPSTLPFQGRGEGAGEAGTSATHFLSAWRTGWPSAVGGAWAALLV